MQDRQFCGVYEQSGLLDSASGLNDDRRGNGKMIGANSIRILTLGAALLTADMACAQMPGEGKSVQPITNGQTNHVFQHEAVRLGLEALGYQVKPALEADYPALHLAIGQGQADYTATHWAPLHQSFYDAAGGDQTLHAQVFLSRAPAKAITSTRLPPIIQDQVF
ncbi:hypothetical protein [Mesorhizobium sp. M1329]|uniref:hypothetical protein n=1 Tax=Mesorhizobium sp. M1329 TaxID=2957083 RepID=UPI003338102B